MKKNYDAVLFDFDGTLADTGEGIFESVRYAVEALGKPPLSDKQLRSFIGPPIYDSFMNMLDLDHDQTEFAAMKYRERYAEGAMFSLRLYDGIPELLKKLRESGIKVSVASSKPCGFIERIVGHLGMREDFDYIAAPAGDDKPESKCELITRAAKALGADRSRVLMVGDRRDDMQGARNCGLDAAAVLYGYGSREEAAPFAPVFMAADCKELTEWILRPVDELSHS